MQKLETGDVIYYVEGETIQSQKIISTRLKTKIEASGLLWTKDLKVAGDVLNDHLSKQLEDHVEDQMNKFR